MCRNFGGSFGRHFAVSGRAKATPCFSSGLPVRMLLLSLAAAALIISINAQEVVDYSYDPSSPIGPSEWYTIRNADTDSPYYDYTASARHPIHDLALNGNQCRTNVNNYRPSPLHLIPTTDRPFTECIDRHEMLTRQIDPDLTCTPYDATFEITPQTLRMYLPPSDDTTRGGCFRPRLNLSGNFPEEFIFAFLEIHLRSEHLVDGKRYDGEIQMVHFGQGEDRHLATIVSVLLDGGGRVDHLEFQWLLDQWQRVADDMEAECSYGNGRSAGDEEEKDGGGMRCRRMMAAMEVEGRDEVIERRRRRMKLLMESEEGDDNKSITSEYATPRTEEEYVKAYYGRNAASAEDVTREDVSEEGEEVDITTDQDQDHQQQHQQRRRRAQYGDASCRADKRGHGCPGYGKRRKQFPYTLWPTIYYYGYRGSLTTPPCSDAVNWRVLDVPLKISKRQLGQLARLLDPAYRNGGGSGDCGRGEDRSTSRLSPTGENYRPIQPRGQADIFHCTASDFRPFMYLPKDQ
mmetsp:Transcript_25589/g.55972  ORF Transcript_25589/g.55972 Transcript_25589/m.55972 type:complete len:517 (-) Transcript_25589:142-1692(-)